MLTSTAFSVFMFYIAALQEQINASLAGMDSTVGESSPPDQVLKVQIEENNHEPLGLNIMKVPIDSRPHNGWPHHSSTMSFELKVVLMQFQMWNTSLFRVLLEDPQLMRKNKEAQNWKTLQCWEMGPMKKRFPCPCNWVSQNQREENNPIFYYVLKTRNEVSVILLEFWVPRSKILNCIWNFRLQRGTQVLPPAT